MRTMINIKTGSKLNITKHIITSNMWEYYITDNKFDDNTVMCLVMGVEQELGDVYLPELKGHILSATLNLKEVLPAEGWKWE